MFKRVTHGGAVEDEAEILFSTPFGYLFPDAARSPLCVLPAGRETVSALNALGSAMADQGTPGDPIASLDSEIPAAFTYFGQFVDHDVTARTDRDGAVTKIGDGVPIVPLDPDVVVRSLRNGRRPKLDLDNLFGDGPGLAGAATGQRALTESQALYDDCLRLHVFAQPGRVDCPGRTKVTGADGTVTFPPLIADMRNDENLNVSQLHATMLRFYNAVYAAQAGNAAQKYVRGRQLVRWAYQYVVVHDYLPTVCDANVVNDTVANGPRFYGASAGRGDGFMPLEFSVAAYRFGHSLIRPFYKINDAVGEIPLMDVLGPGRKPSYFDADLHLRAEFVLDWHYYIGEACQRARKIDTKISHDLFTLPDRAGDPVLANLAKSNLLRGYNLSIPTGQAMCAGFGVNPLSPDDILGGEDPAIADIVKSAGFHRRTPLWYYVLREAALQQGGNRLGEVGSRIVCETLIGQLKHDPNSYLNNRADLAVAADGIKVGPSPGGRISTLHELLGFAGAHGLDHAHAGNPTSRRQPKQHTWAGRYRPTR